MNIIEKLKDNKIAWMFLSKEEQECLKQANEKGAVENLNYTGEWDSPEKIWTCLSNGMNHIWRIKPDYQPEPEYADVEIKEEEGWLGIKKEDWPKGLRLPVYYGTRYFLHLYCLPSLPNFERFYYHADFGKTPSVGLVQVAAKMDQKHIVYARFRNAGD